MALILLIHVDMTMKEIMFYFLIGGTVTALIVALEKSGHRSFCRCGRAEQMVSVVTSLQNDSQS